MANYNKILDIKYNKSNEYGMFPATGSCGGPTPSGEIMCHFYVEYPTLPSALTVEINETTGEVKENVKIDDVNKLTREIQATIVMRPDIAKMVGEWLIKNADEVINRSRPK
jgi:hypothetical protein